MADVQSSDATAATEAASTSDKRFADIPELDYETAFDEMLDIIYKLDQGNIALDEGVQLWERGEHLAQHCEALLTQARGRIERVTAPPQKNEYPSDQPHGTEVSDSELGDDIPF